MRQSRTPTPYRRDGVWYLRKRVPKSVAHLDRRQVVWLSTNILIADDPKGLKSRCLLPTKERSFYSLRHTFEDRLTAVAS